MKYALQRITTTEAKIVDETGKVVAKCYKSCISWEWFIVYPGLYTSQSYPYGRHITDAFRKRYIILAYIKAGKMPKPVPVLFPSGAGCPALLCAQTGLN